MACFFNKGKEEWHLANVLQCRHSFPPYNGVHLLTRQLQRIRIFYETIYGILQYRGTQVKAFEEYTAQIPD